MRLKLFFCKKSLLGLVLSTLAGCSSFHEYRPVNLEQKVAQGRDGYESPNEILASYQVVLSSENSWGMGVVISSTRIATAAHVVNGMSVGDEVVVKYASSVKTRYSMGKAVIRFIDPRSEIAVLDLVKGQFPPAAVPKFCSNSVGGNKLSSLAPVINGETLSPYLGLVGYTTNIAALPKVSFALNEYVKNGGFPPQEATGQERVTAFVTSSTKHGNSGGALYDVEQRCVVGVISLGVPISAMDAPDQVAKELGLSENVNLFSADLLFAVPISAFRQYQ